MCPYMKLDLHKWLTILIALFIGSLLSMLTFHATLTQVLAIGLSFIACGLALLRFKSNIAPAMYGLQVPAYRARVSEQKFMEQLITFGIGGTVVGVVVVISIPLRYLI